LRTLVVSDLHIGAGQGRMALDDAALSTLTDAIAGYDRLVLLGDVIELRERPLADALAAASRVLPQLAGGLGQGREVIVLLGNHDHQLQMRLAARRRLRAPRPLPGPPHDDPCL
jgi:UDP-2,3-diacylglucosamine pyrophosphatase LpxH